MATVEDIKWGYYKNYEGPFYPGKFSFKLRLEATEDEKILAVVTATEGGKYDAINMYDGPPILSSGLIQYTEGSYFSVSRMLGYAFERCPLAYKAFKETLSSKDCSFTKDEHYSFTKDELGSWAFYGSSGECVSTRAEQEQLFRCGSTGVKGTWTEEARSLAKWWAAAVASVWEGPEAQRVQGIFIAPRIRRFAFGGSVDVIRAAEVVATPAARAFVAAYLSFAVNNPSRADKHLRIALQSVKAPVFSSNWLIHILRELTFGSKISIYPERYNAIRPKLEEFYGVDLPDFHEELESWKREHGFRSMLSTVEVQKALIALGEDLGPHGADGVYGPKTRAALQAVELRAGANPGLCDGMVDDYTYAILKEALYKKGSELLTETLDVENQ